MQSGTGWVVCGVVEFACVCVCLWFVFECVCVSVCV
jgi:hypothetical protein